MTEQQQAPARDQRSREQLLELVLLGLVVLAVVVLGLPVVLKSLRTGSVDLATLFYPVLLVAFLGLARSRRTGG